MKILLIVYDNNQLVQYFPIGTAYVASALKRAGHDVTIFHQDISHLPDSAIKALIEKEHHDVVGLGFVGNYYTYRKVLSISEVINSCKPRPRFILGGHGPSADPSFFLRKTGADCVVYGEGERGIELALQSYGVIEEGLVKDLDSIPMIDYSMFPIQHYRLKREPNCSPTDFVMPVITARGCPYKCNFCFRMDEGYRLRSIPYVMEEVNYLRTWHGITYIDFADELTMPNEKRMMELCEAMLPLKMKWMCNGRLNVAKPKLLKLMKHAGCVFINYGIESMDDEVLKTMHKQQTVEQIYKGIEATLAAGISPGFNIIFGHIGDTKENLLKAMSFILKYDDGAQRRTMLPVTPYPGTELFKYCIEKGLIKNTEDFYAKHINADLPTVNLTDLTDDEFRMAMFEVNTQLLTNHYRKLLNDAVDSAKAIYFNKDTSFRGFR